MFPVAVPSIKLSSNGGVDVKMPLVGLGLWKGGDVSDLEIAIDNALETGYRHFDTAYFYETENVLGKCIKKWIDAGKGKREDLFIVTKLPWNGMRPDLVPHFMSLSLKELDLSYVDLYLVHWPVGVKYVSDKEFIPKKPTGEIDIDVTTYLEGIWQAMESLVDNGQAKTIGISNFTIPQIQRIQKIARIMPANHQVEIHLYFQQVEMRKFCLENGISMCAYSPLGGPWRKNMPELNIGGHLPSAVNLLEDPVLLNISRKYGKTPSQIALRFLTQQGIIVIPKSSNPTRLAQNINMFDFSLEESDMTTLKGLDKQDGRANFAWAELKYHPEVPF